MSKRENNRCHHDEEQEKWICREDAFNSKSKGVFEPIQSAQFLGVCIRVCTIVEDCSYAEDKSEIAEDHQVVAHEIENHQWFIHYLLVFKNAINIGLIEWKWYSQMNQYLKHKRNIVPNKLEDAELVLVEFIRLVVCYY